MKKYFTSEDLAKLVKKLRGDNTQEYIAKKIGVSKQAISKAENPSIGSKINKLRINIIEDITGKKVNGPYWYINEIDND